MRRSLVRFVAAAASLPFAVVAACSGDDPPQSHGPIFDVDGGADAPRDALLDGATSSDAAGDAGTDGGAVDDGAITADMGADDAGGCTARTAVVLGNATALFQAIAVGRGAFTVSTRSVAVLSPPALAAAGREFVTAFRTTGDALSYAVTTSGAWGSPQALGKSTPVAPALTSLGAAVHLVYADALYKYAHGTYSGGGWDALADLVVAGDAGAQSFGPSAVGLTAVGSSLVFAHRSGTGGDTQLWAETLSGGAWSAVAVGSAQSEPLVPALVAMSGGGADAMVAYVAAGGTYKISYATHASGAWSGGAKVDDTVYSTDPVSLAPLSGGRAVLVFRGGDGHGYATVWSGTGWSLPATDLHAGLAGPPVVAPGTCGDEAIAVLPLAGADAVVARFAGGSWGAAGGIAGATGATSAAVASVQ